MANDVWDCFPNGQPPFGVQLGESQRQIFEGEKLAEQERELERLRSIVSHAERLLRFYYGEPIPAGSGDRALLEREIEALRK